MVYLVQTSIREGIPELLIWAGLWDGDDWGSHLKYILLTLSSCEISKYFPSNTLTSKVISFAECIFKEILCTEVDSGRKWSVEEFIVVGCLDILILLMQSVSGKIKLYF